MSSTTIDYTNIDNSAIGSVYQAAVKLEIQHAQTDMATKAENATNETISGTWTFTASVTTVERLNIQNIPTSSAGLNSGDVWSDSGTLKIVT